MTRRMTRHRVAGAAGLGLVAGLAAVGMVAAAVGGAQGPVRVAISIHYSHFQPSAIVVPAGRPITFVLVNDDPIDHEWIVGDAALHARHRTGTEPRHGSRPTEVSLDAGATRTTSVTFDTPGTLTFVCHLPGHEAYGMTGTVVVTGR
jgi:uncharacterized cupredoxin-like copper-binding protein